MILAGKVKKSPGHFFQLKRDIKKCLKENPTFSNETQNWRRKVSLKWTWGQLRTVRKSLISKNFLSQPTFSKKERRRQYERKALLGVPKNMKAFFVTALTRFHKKSVQFGHDERPRVLQVLCFFKVSSKVKKWKRLYLNSVLNIWKEGPSFRKQNCSWIKYNFAEKRNFYVSKIKCTTPYFIVPSNFP